MDKLKNILILGSLPSNDLERQLYQAIIKIAEEFSAIVKSPIDTAEFNWTTGERYDRAFRTVAEADLVIGEQTHPSTGQGMEIRECHILEKPLIVIAKTGSKVSGLVKWCPITQDIIYYDDIGDMKIKLRESIKKFLTKSRTWAL